MKAAVVLAVTVLLALPAPARADEGTARAHYASGRAYYEQGRYEDALREFEEAARAAPDAQKGLMVFNVAQAQERLGRLQDAIGSFQLYLELTPDAEDRSTVEERIRTLQGRVAETGIVLTVSEAGAQVFIDDQPSGTTPLEGPVRVTAGSHEVRVEKQGFRPFRLRMSVETGRRVEAEVTLVPVERATPTGPARSARPESSGPGPLPWMVGGLGVVALAGGAVLGVLALDHSDNANAERANNADVYDDELGTAQTLALLTDISLAVGVLAAGTSVVLFLISGGGGHDDEAPAPASLRAAPLLAHDGGGLTISGVF